MTTPPSGDRLERALSLFLQTPPTTRAAAEQLLAAHPDLADLLGPMVDGGSEANATEQGRVLGDFRLVREIGRGGMGIVYEAWQASLDRRVAVKVLSPALAASPAAVARLRREAAAAGRLRHPNIVEVHGHGHVGDQHFFAMQLVAGQALHDCASRFRAPAKALAVAIQLTDALAHAHARGLVHRDVKPANVLVQDDDRVLLTDFGVARDETLPSLTIDGGFLGTIDYASPEQVRGEAVDARTDIWAVGVILHELLTSRSPFAAPTQEALLKNILTSEPAPLLGRDGISRDLAAVVDRCLQKDPRRRYLSATALLADLQALTTGERVTARLPSTWERLQRWTRREPWRAFAAAIVAIGLPALAGIAGYLWANAPRIRSAAAAEREELREQRLADAWLLAESEDHEAGLQALADLPADEEVVCARAWLLWRTGRNRDGELAAATIDSAATRLLRQAMASPREAIATPGATASSLELFLAAQLLLLQSQAAGVEPDSMSRRRGEWLQSAVLRSPRPRLVHHTALASAARGTRDQQACNDVAQALQTLWPNDPIAQHSLFRIYALIDPQRALAMWPQLPAGRQRRLHFDRGLACEKLGQLAEAEQANRDALTFDPTRHRAHANLGAVLRKQKRAQESAAALRRAVELAPGNPHYWQLLGLSLRDAKEPEAAVAAFEQSASLDRGYAVPCYQLGNLRKGQGDLEGAARHYAEAIRRDPDYLMAIANLSDALTRLGRRQEALPFAFRAAHLAPGELIPHYNVASIARELDLHDIALTAARKAVEVAGKDPRAHALLARTLLARQPPDTKAALASARTAEELGGGEELEHRLLLVRALVADGIQQEARAQLAATAAEPRRRNDADQETIRKLQDELGLND